MKKTLFGLLALAGVSVSLAGVSALAHADTKIISDQMPTNGYVALNNQDKVIEASSPSLLDTNETSKNKTSLLFGTSFTALTPVSSHGTWTYYTDHHGLNNYKWSHSNYHDTKYYHYGEARVGKGGYVTRYASAGHWAYATAKGHGTAYAYYGFR